MWYMFDGRTHSSTLPFGDSHFFFGFSLSVSLARFGTHLPINPHHEHPSPPLRLRFRKTFPSTRADSKHLNTSLAKSVLGKLFASYAANIKTPLKYSAQAQQLIRFGVRFASHALRRFDSSFWWRQRRHTVRMMPVKVCLTTFHTFYPYFLVQNIVRSYW